MSSESDGATSSNNATTAAPELRGLEIVQRRIRLSNLIKHCPAYGEMQLQIHTWWMRNKPASFKCRICKFEFEISPIENGQRI